MIRSLLRNRKANIGLALFGFFLIVSIFQIGRAHV